jgi:citrate lyase beta subunit
MLRKDSPLPLSYISVTSNVIVTSQLQQRKPCLASLTRSVPRVRGGHSEHGRDPGHRAFLVAPQALVLPQLCHHHQLHYHDRKPASHERDEAAHVQGAGQSDDRGHGVVPQTQGMVHQSVHPRAGRSRNQSGLCYQPTNHICLLLLPI